MNQRKEDNEIDNKNWQILFDTQFENLQKDGRISKYWINGFSKLGLNNEKVPTVPYLNSISKGYTGWEFIQTNEEFADPIKWNEEIVAGKMSISNFVRTPDKLFYCDQPDKWHDIIGHIPLLMQREYSDMYRAIAKLYIDAYRIGGNEKRLQVGNINWFITEVGIIQENNKLKAFGATLYSSSGELENAFASPPEVCTLEKLISLPRYNRSDIQSTYFVIDSVNEVYSFLDEYRKKYL